MTDLPAAVVDLAVRLVDASGAAIRPYFRTGFAVDRKADASPVTAADRDAEQAIRRLLAAERPEDGVIGEEFGADRADAEWVWVIDPIDGTKSFVIGRPIFGTLVGLLHRGRPVLGVIDQPIIGDRWVGAAGRPTLFNGRPAQASPSDGPAATLAGATLATTAPEAFSGRDAERFERVRRAVATPIYGGDCYNYGLVASGTLDLVIEAGLKLHDFAALAPVVTGAGGTMTDWNGAPLDIRSDGRVVAAGNARIHAEALALLG